MIRDFQEGTFNVLVCTCIGEEGLDIGEVDLIVNYDTLRSPIRMIQRVGRTGRKRDGRVVCLISEGQEQKDMIRSKNNEKSLQRALRRSDNFKLRPNRVMFPEEPRLVRRTMVVTEKLRLSQVGGHAAPQRTKKETPSELFDNWKLSAQVESIRFQTFGPMVGVTPCTKSFPVCLRRKLVRARAKSHALVDRSVNRIARWAHTGTSRLLLLSIETLSDEKGRSTAVRKIRVAERDSVGLFPIEGTKCSKANVIIKRGWNERVPLPTLSRIKLAVPPPPTDPEKVDIAVLQTNADEVPPQRGSLLQSSNQLHSLQPTIVNFKPFLSHKENRVSEESDPICESPQGAMAMSIEERPSEAVHFKLPTPPVSSSESDEDDETEVESVSDFNTGIAISVAPALEIVFPTPNLNKYAESEIPDVVRKEELRSTAKLEGAEDVSGCHAPERTNSLAGQESVSGQRSLDIGSPRTSSAQFVLLPTQDSSSSEESGCADDESSVEPDNWNFQTEDAPAEAPQNYESRWLGVKKGDVGPFVNGAEKHELASHDGDQCGRLNHVSVQATSGFPEQSNEISFNADLVDTPNSTSQSGKQLLPSQQSPRQLKDVESESEFEFHESSPEVVTRRSRAVSRKDVIMTQQIETAQCRRENVDTPKAKQELCNVIDILVDTPLDKTGRLEATQDQDASDIICAVCHCGDSNHADPIVLCDGANSIQCDYAVHASCYSLETSVLNRLREWRCDVCQLKSTAKALVLNPRCLVCQGPGGILKHSSLTRTGVWIHPFCMNWTNEDATILCDFCSFPGALTCAFSSCARAAHPHCVMDIAPDKCWLTIVDTEEKSSSMFCFQHRHEKYSSYRFRPVEEETRTPRCFVLPSCRVEKLISSTSATRQRVMPDTYQAGQGWYDKVIIKDRNKKKASRVRREPSPDRNDRRQRVRQNLMKRHRGMLHSSFIHSEADIDSDEDIEGDEEESDLRRIDEEEELAALDFINDSSQLGTYTQDVLDRVDHEDGESIWVHRRLDIENERKRQFSTPILNRRMIRRSTDSGGSEARDESQNSSTSRSSLKGLGNCHFIRSVIEHARQGGDSDDIEAVYNEVEQEVALEDVGGVDDDMQIIPSRIPFVLEYVPSDDEEDGGVNDGDGSPPREPAPPGLTVEQRARMEEKRLEALARRQGKA